MRLYLQFIEYPRGWTCALPGHSEGRRGDRRVQDGRVAQWITRLPTEQKIPGSNPGALDIKLFSNLSATLQLL